MNVEILRDITIKVQNFESKNEKTTLIDTPNTLSPFNYVTHHRLNIVGFVTGKLSSIIKSFNLNENHGDSLISPLKITFDNIFPTFWKKLMLYLVGPYYAGPKSTPAHFTPALIPPRANFDLPPFRAAFNATIGKNQKNQKKGKVLKLQEQLFRFQCVFFPAE